MLTRLGHLTVRRRRLILSLTGLFMVVAGVLGSRAFAVLADGGFEDPGSQSAQAEALLDHHFDAQEPNLVLVVTAAGGNVDDPAAAAAAATFATAVGGVGHVVDVSSYWELGSPPSLRSVDGDRALVLAVTDREDDQVETAIEDVRALAEDLEARADGVGAPAITVAVGGADAAGIDIGTTIEGDLARAESIAVPITCCSC